jgi:hypothetical protein
MNSFLKTGKWLVEKSLYFNQPSNNMKLPAISNYKDNMVNYMKK